MAEVFGLKLDEVPEGWRPTKMIAVVECLDPASESGGSGAMRMSTRATNDLTLWSAIGMLRAALADLEQQYVASLSDA